MLKELGKYTIRPRREIKEFLTTVTLYEVGLNMMNIFEPVYLYTLGVSLTGIVLFYLAVYLPYFLLLPVGGRVAKSFGFEHTMTIGLLFSVSYYLALIAIPAAPIFLYIAPLLYALQKAFWWPGYHANFARYSRRRETGREIGVVQVITNVTAAAGPLIGGLIVAVSNFTVLYTVVIIVTLLSAIPMFTTPERFKPKDLRWLEQIRYIFSRTYRHNLVTALGFGEELVAMTLWPIFIYLVVNSAFNLGALVASATALTVLATTIAARWSDERRRAQVYRWGAVLNTLSWIGRPLLIMPLAILGIDTVYRTSKSLIYVPMYSRVYDDAKENHVMLEVVAFEGTLVLGKIVMLLILLVVVPWAGFVGAFVAAAVASLFYFAFRLNKPKA
ncbi:MAG: MFS transporter [Parcubacteria group bacterium]